MKSWSNRIAKRQAESCHANKGENMKNFITKCLNHMKGWYTYSKNDLQFDAINVMVVMAFMLLLFYFNLKIAPLIHFRIHIPVVFGSFVATWFFISIKEYQAHLANNTDAAYEKISSRIKSSSHILLAWLNRNYQTLGFSMGRMTMNNVEIASGGVVENAVFKVLSIKSSDESFGLFVVFSFLTDTNDKANAYFHVFYTIDENSDEKHRKEFMNNTAHRAEWPGKVAKPMSEIFSPENVERISQAVLDHNNFNLSRTSKIWVQGGKVVDYGETLTLKKVWQDVKPEDEEKTAELVRKVLGEPSA